MTIDQAAELEAFYAALWVGALLGAGTARSTSRSTSTRQPALPGQPRRFVFPATPPNSGEFPSWNRYLLPPLVLRVIARTWATPAKITTACGVITSCATFQFRARESQPQNRANVRGGARKYADHVLR
jgi:hypothetical protein